MIGVLVLGQAVGLGLSNHDDTALITNNQPFLRDLSNLFGVFCIDLFDRMASGADGSCHRPVLFQSMILDNAVSSAVAGDSLALFHASNTLCPQKKGPTPESRPLVPSARLSLAGRIFCSGRT